MIVKIFSQKFFDHSIRLIFQFSNSGMLNFCLLFKEKIEIHFPLFNPGFIWNINISKNKILDEHCLMTATNVTTDRQCRPFFHLVLNLIGIFNDRSEFSSISFSFFLIKLAKNNNNDNDWQIIDIFSEKQKCQYHSYYLQDNSIRNLCYSFSLIYDDDIFCLSCTQYCRIIIVFHCNLKIFNLKNSILMMIWHFFFVWFNSWKIIMLLMMNAISQKNFSKTFLGYNDWKKNNHYLHTPKYYSQKYWFFLKGKSETQREKQNDFGYEWDDDDCEKEKNIDHNKIIK